MKKGKKNLKFKLEGYGAIHPEGYNIEVSFDPAEDMWTVTDVLAKRLNHPPMILRSVEVMMLAECVRKILAAEMHMVETES